VSALKWIFLRLPASFAVTFGLISLAWALWGFHFLDLFSKKYLAESATRTAAFLLPDPIYHFLDNYSYLSNLDQFIHALVILFGFVAGFLIAYNISAFVTWGTTWLPANPAGKPSPMPSPPRQDASPIEPFSKFERIGIVLAGGGAKGAFQAGAMKAIYEYLDQHQALGKVKVIASTSIGSWNAMFWLAHLINPGSAGSALETWWKSINAKSLIAPSWYLPFARNAFLSQRPWQNQFDEIFLRCEVKDFIFNCKSDIHFYMTRTNVRSGKLECTTNNPNPADVNDVTYRSLAKYTDANEFLAHLKVAVFASMDIPPLFPYMNYNDELFEDGGVVDNLPLSFASIEGCDLVFVLPLNSDFEQSPNQSSVIYRISRLLDVQQGMLERHGFKLLYLYNEIAALRHHIAELDGGTKQAYQAEGPRADEPKSLETALRRKHEQMKVFAVCPHKSFALETINTRDLWNKKGARKAFDVMYEVTAKLLTEFRFDRPQEHAQVAIVTEGKSITWDDRF
jgi:NTE family protein